jgi:hypothetical protein
MRDEGAMWPVAFALKELTAAVDWDPRFHYEATSEEAGLTMVRFTPETVVVRDQSYKPTRWARAN